MNHYTYLINIRKKNPEFSDTLILSPKSLYYEARGFSCLL